LPNGQPSTAALLQDRSYELDPNNILGVEGRQRGFNKQKRPVHFAEIGYLLTSAVTGARLHLIPGK